MPVLKNPLGDQVTVDCGGTGGDNVFGTVEEKVGQNHVPVANARVRIINLSNGQDTDPAVKTNVSGAFDVDLDASNCDRIYVHAEWKDGNNTWHVVSGTFKCPCPTPGGGGGTGASLNERLQGREELIARLESLAVQTAARAMAERSASASIHAEVQRLVTAQLNDLALTDDAARQKAVIDRALLSELLALLEKMRLARSDGSYPPPDVLWDILQEMVNLLLKLTLKAFVLQGMPLPRIPEDPGPIT